MFSLPLTDDLGVVDELGEEPGNQKMKRTSTLMATTKAKANTGFTCVYYVGRNGLCNICLTMRNDYKGNSCPMGHFPPLPCSMKVYF